MSFLIETPQQIDTGELAGSATALQMPSISCQMVMFKAISGNVGNVYIGPAGATIPNGTTDLTSGWVLEPGQESGWIPVDNMDRLYRICDNAGDDLVYMAVQ